MIAAHLELMRGTNALATRAAQLRERCAAGEADAWPAYLDALRTLAAVVAMPAAADARALLTTAQLAERLDVSTRTVRRRQAARKLAPARAGKRGRTALWPAAAGLLAAAMPHRPLEQAR